MIEILIGFISGIFSRNGNGRRNNINSSPFNFFRLNQHTAQATNLVFFIPTAVTSVFIGIKNKNINIKESWIVLVAGIIGTIISAKLSSKMNVELLRKMFGIFLLIIAIYEIYSWYKTYIKKEKGHTRSNQKCNMKG